MRRSTNTMIASGSGAPNALRFGIIGCGVIEKVHARAIASLLDAHLVAVSDADHTRAQALGAECGVLTYASLEAMLHDADLDVVTICTPSGMHDQHAIAGGLSGPDWFRHASQSLQTLLQRMHWPYV